MPRSNKMNKLSRRQFAGAIAAGTAPLAALAIQDELSANEQRLEANPSALIKPLTEVDRILEIVQRRYPDTRLDAAALGEIRGDLEVQLVRSALLSRHPLQNSDEPAFIQSAWRAAD